MRTLGATGIAAVMATLVAVPAAAVTIQTVATGLDHPWSLAFVDDGGVLVTERSGRLSLIARGKAPVPVSGVPAVYAKSQGGLFDVLPDPDFARNRLIYLSYAAGSDGANFTRVARARLDGTALRDVKVIFQVSPAKDTPVHFGGRMAFLADGTLAVTTGDGFDRREQAQRLQSGLGKVMRIRTDGSVPADNPFARTAGAQAAIWSLGHRNPQGLAFDGVSGRLYEHEHGPRGGDEVNIITRGGNYGWPIATKGLDYSGATISPFKTYKGMKDGIVVWVPSIAPSGLAVVRGPMWKDWQGDLLVGALVSQEIRRIDLDANGKVLGQERVFAQVKARVRDVRVAPDGAIWATTDEAGGKVLRISE